MLDYRPWTAKLLQLLRGAPLEVTPESVRAFLAAKTPPPPLPAVLQRARALNAACPTCGGGPVLRTPRTGPVAVCETCAAPLLVFVDGRVRALGSRSLAEFTTSRDQLVEAQLLWAVVRGRIGVRPRPIDCGAAALALPEWEPEPPIFRRGDLARIARDFEASLGEPTPDWFVSCLGCDRKILAVRTPWPPRGWSGLVYWDPTFPLRRRCDSLVPFAERGNQPWGVVYGGLHECRAAA